MEPVKENSEKKKTVKVIDYDQTTEEFVKTIRETITPDLSENKYENCREVFEILFPDGKKRKVLMYPAETLQDVQDRLDKKFGPDCVYVGLKKGGTTKDPDEEWMLGMFNTDDYKETISIVAVWIKNNLSEITSLFKF